MAVFENVEKLLLSTLIEFRLFKININARRIVRKHFFIWLLQKVTISCYGYLNNKFYFSDFSAWAEKKFTLRPI